VDFTKTFNTLTTKIRSTRSQQKYAQHAHNKNTLNILKSYLLEESDPPNAGKRL